MDYLTGIMMNWLAVWQTSGRECGRLVVESVADFGGVLGAGSSLTQQWKCVTFLKLSQSQCKFVFIYLSNAVHSGCLWVWSQLADFAFDSLQTYACQCAGQLTHKQTHLLAAGVLVWPLFQSRVRTAGVVAMSVNPAFWYSAFGFQLVAPNSSGQIFQQHPPRMNERGKKILFLRLDRSLCVPTHSTPMEATQWDMDWTITKHWSFLRDLVLSIASCTVVIMSCHKCCPECWT